MDAPVLHLSLAVAELVTTKDFYERVLGCRPGRQRDDWVDVWFFGMQLTLQQRPEEVRPLADQGVRHFGVVLAPGDFDALVARVDAAGGSWIEVPTIHTAAGSSGKRGGKLADPSGNVIEVKCYDSPADRAAFAAGVDHAV